MNVRLPEPLRMLSYGAIAVLALCGQPARGSVLTADLTCVLTGHDAYSCGSTSYGTVTLEDGVNGGRLRLTVDVEGVAGKFRDLMLNFDGSEITSVWSGDGQASLALDGYHLPPYLDGMFDIGGSGQQNWSSNSPMYTTLLTGNGALPLTSDMFDVRDSLGNLNVLLQLQDPTSSGDSLKVGGVWAEGERAPMENPEPTTAALLGCGLIALAWVRRRRRSS